MIKTIKKYLVVAGAVLMLMPQVSEAAESSYKVPQHVWPHQGMTGTYDRAALQRGFQVYKEVCAACHSMDLLSYRHLEGIGFTAEEVKAIASQYSVIDGPNDEGEMFERVAKPSDRFSNPYPNEQAARYANNGAYPPDMSLLIKARPDGEDYIFALLTGYDEAPAGTDMMEGMSWNKYFPGHQIAMVAPLSEGMVAYADGTEPDVEQMARDVVQFMAWASEPHLEDRKRMGWKVLIFLTVLAGLLYAMKRRLWANVH